MKISLVPECEKDVKFLCKKYRKFDEDLDVYKKILNVHFNERTLPADVVIISHVGQEYYPIWHAEKFYCEALRSTRKIRVIFTYNPYTDEVLLIEIYCKNHKDNHDQNRMKYYAVKKQLPS